MSKQTELEFWEPFSDEIKPIIIKNFRRWILMSRRSGSKFWLFCLPIGT